MADDRSGDSHDDSPVRIARPSSESDEPISRPYSIPSRLERGRPLESLVPVRLLMIGLTTAGCLVLVALLLLMYLWADAWTDVLSADQQALLDLEAPGNLSRWFASTLLGALALVALFTFSLRRHRLDDYHGRYRVWLWTVLGCLLASLGETTSATRVAEELCQQLGNLTALSAHAAWTAVLAMTLAAIGIRMLFEVWRSRAAAAALVASGLAIGTAFVVHLGVSGDLSDAARAAVTRGAWLVGYVLAFTACLLYTRHVLREIEGLVAVPVRRRKIKAASARDNGARRDDASPKPASKARTDLDPVRTSEFRTTHAVEDEEEEDEEEVERPMHPGRNQLTTAHGGLSRAERRRLRREASRKAS